jgi:hypothetical protein
VKDTEIEKTAAEPIRRRLPSPSRAMVTTLFLDIGLSVIAYFVAQLFGASTYEALLIGTVVSGVRIAWVGVRQRRLDPFALFLMLLFGAGLALTLVTGDVRFLLAKDSATSCTAGLVLLGSCLINRPLAYYAAKRFAAASGAAEFERTAHTDGMRRRWYRVSMVWGVGLLVESGLRVAAIYLLPITVAADLSQVLMIAAIAALLIWTVRSAKRESSRRESALA